MIWVVDSECQLECTSLSLEQKVRPTFAREPVDARARVTNDVELPCEVRGVPTPAVQWYKNGELLVESEYFQVSSEFSPVSQFLKVELERSFI